MSVARSRLAKMLASCYLVAAFIVLAGDTLPVPPTAAAPPVAPSSVVASSPCGQSFNSYAYGYGTYYVASRRTVPPCWGDARAWYQRAQANGFATGTTPVPGAIAWTTSGLFGHVAYVEEVLGEHVLVSEMHFDNGNWNRITFRWARANTFHYIY